EAIAITSGGGGSAAAITADENQTAVTTVTAVDADGDTPAYSIAGGAYAAAFAIDSASGVLTLLMPADFEAPTDADANGVFEVVVQAADGRGAFDTQAISVTITDQNEAIAITSGGGGSAAAITADENQTAVTTVTATDADGDTPAYSIAGGADAAAFAIDSASGVLTLLLPADFEAPTDTDANGVFEVVVQAADGRGAFDTQALAVTITDTGEAPIAVADAFAATEDTPLSRAAASGVLANDTDPEGQPLTAQLLTPPAAGTLLLGADGAFTYTPAAEFAGVDTFVYRVSDGVQASPPVTVTITVAAVDDPPVAAADGYAAAGSNTLVVPATAGVLANDTDVDSGLLTAVLIDAPTAGALSLAADGGFVFAPPPGFFGQVQFTYRVSDGVTTSPTTTVTVDVLAAPDQPLDPVEPPDGGNNNAGDDHNDGRHDEDEETGGGEDAYAAPPGEGLQERLAGKLLPPPTDTPTPPRGPGAAATEEALSAATLDTLQVRTGDDASSASGSASYRPRPARLAAAAAPAGPAAIDPITTTEASLDAIEQLLASHQQQALDEESVQRFVAGAASSLFGGLSAAYVAWVLRGSYLAAAMATSLPAWVRFDPIYVLDDSAMRTSGHDDPEDSRSLANLINAEVLKRRLGQ
ncbi:MAG: tandem-95 repeat protein, partial [Planctomycetota bacterium]